MRCRQNNCIRGVDTSTALVSTLAGNAAMSGAADGVGTDAQFFLPYSIAMDADSTFAVVVSAGKDFWAEPRDSWPLPPTQADALNDRIRVLNMANLAVTTLAGSGPGYADGQGTAALFSLPASVAMDAAGSFVLVGGEFCLGRPPLQH